MLTLQEVFDKMAAGLLTQGERSRRDGGLCAYRGTEGRKCAAGFLMLDEHYEPELEGYAARFRIVRGALIASGVDMNDGNTHRLVRAGQDIHDDYDVATWRDRLIELAKRYELSAAVCK